MTESQNAIGHVGTRISGLSPASHNCSSPSLTGQRGGVAVNYGDADFEEDPAHLPAERAEENKGPLEPPAGSRGSQGSPDEALAL